MLKQKIERDDDSKKSHHALVPPVRGMLDCRRGCQMALAPSVNFRRYQLTDYDPVASLWTRINRELAPPGMEKMFEQYIAVTIDGELRQLLEVFSEAKRNCFWVIEDLDRIVGCFGIESHNATDTELR